jgi:hypothetical protein
MRELKRTLKSEQMLYTLFSGIHLHRSLIQNWVYTHFNLTSLIWSASVYFVSINVTLLMKCEESITDKFFRDMSLISNAMCISFFLNCNNVIA